MVAFVFMLNFSIIVPVYNRPDEIDELLNSLSKLVYEHSFEVIIVEDGSLILCEEVCNKYSNKLNIKYFFKENSGPGNSRNFGMKNANGNYFILIDSDCTVPKDYLSNIHKALMLNFTDCFGGKDSDTKEYSPLQKAVNFVMTSFVTTGGIRGSKKSIQKFQPRSFNMGISKTAFIATNGFKNIHPGEDPELVFRLWNMGFETQFISNAVVNHKRRINFKKFWLQVYKFGKARPILDKWHKKYKSLLHWFPTLFSLGFVISLIFLMLNFTYFLYAYIFYFIILIISSAIKTKNILVVLYIIPAVFIQFFGYGFGYLKSYIYIHILNKIPEETFPELFFKNG